MAKPVRSLLAFILVSSLAWSAGGRRPVGIDDQVFRRFQKKGFVCQVTEVFRKTKVNGSTKRYGPKRESAWMPTRSESRYFYFLVPSHLEEHIDHFGFAFDRIKTISSEYFLYQENETYLSKVLEIDFRSGKGRFQSEATDGGWPINDHTRTEQRVKLEQCRLL
jgi:hypothetical protein